jgi:hypothetical protein
MNDLFIGGGGSAGIIFIGCLEYIHENKLLDLKNFYGTSIGSLIGCLYISGITPKNILLKVLELDLVDIVKYNFNNLLSNNHIINDSLLDNLIGLLWEFIDENITLKKFSDMYNVNVNIYANNITKNNYTSLNNIDYPEIKLKDALKASMSIPFLFKPVVINGDTYLDGCCKNLYGSPPKDVYIRGYSLILNSLGLTDSIGGKLYLSMVCNCKPRSTFTVNCYNELDVSVYLNLDKLDDKVIINMYKKGLYLTKETLESEITSFD